MFERLRERWIVEGKKNPLDRLPTHLSSTIIYAPSSECQEAYSELFAWSRITGVEILDAELDVLRDAREQIGFESTPVIPLRKMVPTLVRNILKHK